MSGVSSLDVVKDALDQISHDQRQNQLVLAANTAELLTRMKRIETRLVRLMEVNGLDEQGQPKPDLMVSRA